MVIQVLWQENQSSPGRFLSSKEVKAEKMKKYSVVSGESDSISRAGDMESVSVASSHRRFRGNKKINSALSEPLTGEAFDDESASDPYFVFRSDLQHQLEVMDEHLAEYLRVRFRLRHNCC